MTAAEKLRDRLLGQLTAQRDHALGIVAGLDAEAMRRPVLPSGWTVLGLIRHLTLDEERFWFHAVVGAEPTAISFFAGRPDTWYVGPGEPAEEVLGDYRRAIRRSDEIIGSTPLDAPPRWWPDGLFGDWRLADLEEILLHMISEVACHAGHLDAARELIDGRQWLVLDEGRG